MAFIELLLSKARGWPIILNGDCIRRTASSSTSITDNSAAAQPIDVNGGGGGGIGPESIRRIPPSRDSDPEETKYRQALPANPGSFQCSTTPSVNLPRAISRNPNHSA